jgi:hypothetical protein
MTRNARSPVRASSSENAPSEQHDGHGEDGLGVVEARDVEQ